MYKNIVKQKEPVPRRMACYIQVPVNVYMVCVYMCVGLCLCLYVYTQYYNGILLTVCAQFFFLSGNGCTTINFITFQLQYKLNQQWVCVCVCMWCELFLNNELVYVYTTIPIKLFLLISDLGNILFWRLKWTLKK